MIAPPLAVLVVEDETLIRLMVAEVLADDGIKVSLAAHASEALATLREQASGLHLMFTDINMPGEMDGLKLACYVREHWPWIALILTSGKVRPTSVEMPAGALFLQKPYNFANMLQEVRLLGDAGPQIAPS